MINKKLLTSILLALAVLFAQVGIVAAAPPTQDTTPITGTIQSIVTETDANNVTTVLVKFVDGQGATQTVRLSLTTAAGLNLVDESTLDVDESQIGQPITIDPTTVIPDEESSEDVHPISALLANFFFDGDPEMASLIDSYHSGDNDAEQVFGFGVIAQALWMSKGLNDGTADTDLAEQILAAKKSGDYSAFELPDGSSPSNWGQFKKALRENKDKHNLGVIVSGQAEDDSEDPAAQLNQDNGKNKNKDKGKGKDKNKNKP